MNKLNLNKMRVPKNTKRCLMISVFLVIIVIVGGFYVNVWFANKIAKVNLGLAEPNFPYREYTAQELDEMYPQIENANVPTRVTPEETYAEFRRALMENKLGLAIDQLSKESGRYDKNVKILTDAYNEGKFVEIYNHYPEQIKQESMYDTIAGYEYDYFSEEYNQELVGYISFTKNSDGDWKMSSL